ncbi:MAG: hypothetical protein QGH82_02935, partial [Candidatus Woesearchaeota archaeon]|nr:hypothetical protein [Candidatus Woesearchaeota archaeon]
MTYTIASMTDFNQLGPIVAYNAQSLRKPGRLEHILGEFQHASIVCINGTRWKAKDDIPVELYYIRGFLVYSAGYGKSSNSHAGVMICLNRRWFTENCVVQHAYATGNIQGRALCLRVKRGQG